MNRVCNISKEQLENFLNEGKTTREIATIVNTTNSTISRYVRLYNLTHLYKKPKYAPYHLNNIDSKELAYLLGFIIADGAITNELVEISIAYEDKELMDLFSNILQIPFRTDLTLDKSKRRFPRVRISRKIIGISKYIGGEKKKDRNVPILSKDLEVYLVRGLFDAEGCITWGRRKDRNRIWQKVTFSSSLNILTSIQKVLYKLNITTTIRPKAKEDCYVLEFANKIDVIKFYNYLYADTSFIPLKRKFDKYNALRLELGEFGESVNNVTPSQAIDHSIEGVETTGEKTDSLNNQNSAQGLIAKK